MRIGIDVRYLSHGLVGGVHTYVAHFVPALIDLAVDHQIFVYADTERPFELKSLPDRATVRYLPWRSPLSTVHNDLFMHRQMSLDRLDVVHFPANYGFGPSGGRTVITIHDALNILPLHEIVRGHPKAPRVMAMTFYLHWCTRLALRRADLLLTVSVHAQKEIARHGCLDPDRIVPVPHAPEPGLRRIGIRRCWPRCVGDTGCAAPSCSPTRLRTRKRSCRHGDCCRPSCATGGS